MNEEIQSRNPPGRSAGSYNTDFPTSYPLKSAEFPSKAQVCPFAGDLRKCISVSQILYGLYHCSPQTTPDHNGS